MKLNAKGGYYGIGIECCKTWANYGTLWRTARILDASFVFLIGRKFKKTFTDPQNSWRVLPVYSYECFDDFYKNLPYCCVLIGVEMGESVQQLEHFDHPERACYLLGSENNGLSRNALDHCHKMIKLRGEQSMNVAVAGSIVMYDRVVKRTPIPQEGSSVEGRKERAEVSGAGECRVGNEEH
jgi:tRNA G18 (ribose-2'-O)-methylase SpoU